MFEHEGLLKEFEWVTKESEKKHIGESIAKTSLEKLVKASNEK